MAVIRPKSHALVALIATFIDSFKRMVADGGAGGAVSGTSGAGSAHTHAFTGTAPSGAETNATTGTGYATSGQVVTTTENFTATLNQYAGHWLLVQGEAPCLIDSHPAVTGAPLVLTVFGLAPPTGATAYRILRAPTPAGTNANESSHTHGAGTFAGAPASSAVHYDRGEYTVTAANASDLDTSVTLCQALHSAYYQHRTDALAHDAVDATNTVAATRASVVGLATAIVVANQLKAAYNAHRAESGVHPNNDSGHAISSADASDQSSLNTLLNELKADMNAHFADGMATPSWRAVDV